MFRWLTNRFRKPKKSVKTVLGVQVTVEMVDGQWFALFRAWDRGTLDRAGLPVPERVAVPAVGPSDALKQARAYIEGLEPTREGQLVWLPQSQWPGGGSLCQLGGPIRHVLVSPDGRCAVFDSAGNQLTQYQGTWDDVGERLMRDASDNTEFVVAFRPAVSDLESAGRSWKLDVRV